MSRIKQRSEDFRVRELLREGVLQASGEWRVYRVIKRKLTSLEAAARLADLAGAAAGDVSMAGMKDRQGVTVQHMALRTGRDVAWRDERLRIESVGYVSAPLTAEASEGNSFEIVVRGLERDEIERLRTNVPLVREQGVVNYFDDQRFGNLRHGQGWIALQLMRAEHEAALRALLTAPSPHDDRRTAAFKAGLARSWGDWAACRDVAGRFGAHHSVFEHLKRNPEDFAGAFVHVSTRLRLIHLYAFQSHLWNRAVAAYMRDHTSPEQRIVVDCVEGPLVFPAGPLPAGPGVPASFRLPGPRLEDVADPTQRALLEDALAHERLVAADFDIVGVSGFQLKGEDRALHVLPRHLRVRPSERDPLNRGMRLVKLRFELPRGAYATLVVKRLLSRPLGQAGEGPPRSGPRDETRDAPPGAREGGPRGRGPRERDSRSGDSRGRDRGPRQEGGRADRGGPRSGPRGPKPPGRGQRRWNES